MIKEGIVYFGDQIQNKISFKKISSKNGEVAALIDHSFLDNAAKELYLKIWMDKQRIFADGLE